MGRLVAVGVITFLLAFPMGAVVGFGVGIWFSGFGESIMEGLDGMEYEAAIERPAEVDAPTTIKRKHYQVSHPSNWKLDREDFYFDPDRYFSIHTPGNSYVLISFDARDITAEELLAETRAQCEEMIEVTGEESFSRWGQYEGTGVALTGSYAGFPSEIRMFCHVSEAGRFEVTEFRYTDSLMFTQAGYDLVESTFVLRKGPGRADDGGEDDGDEDREEDAGVEEEEDGESDAESRGEEAVGGAG